MQEDVKKRIDMLKERKQKIDMQIASTMARMKKEERARDTRRKILAGAYFLEKYKDKEDELKKLLDGFLTKDQDRALFGLGPKK